MSAIENAEYPALHMSGSVVVFFVACYAPTLVLGELANVEGPQEDARQGGVGANATAGLRFPSSSVQVPAAFSGPRQW